MQIEFDTLPVGVEGLYAVQMTQDGELKYLASYTEPGKIAQFTLGVAKAETIRLRYGHPEATKAEEWLPWHTAHLDSKKAGSAFLGRVTVSPYCTLGRA